MSSKRVGMLPMASNLDNGNWLVGERTQEVDHEALYVKERRSASDAIITQEARTKLCTSRPGPSTTALLHH